MNKKHFSTHCYTWLQVNITFWAEDFVCLNLWSGVMLFTGDPAFWLLLPPSFFVSAPALRLFSSTWSAPSSSQLNFGKFSCDTSHWGLQFTISSSPSLAIMIPTPKCLELWINYFPELLFLLILKLYCCY